MEAQLLLQFHDVTPIRPPEAEEPVANIRYKSSYSQALGYLYAMMAVGEKSRRCLELTQAVIYMASAFYTVWDYRYQVVEHLGGDWESEWPLCYTILEDNAKNYQLWNYRRRVAMGHPDPAANVPLELDFAAKALRQPPVSALGDVGTTGGGDAKNYHAWQHRVFLIRTFGSLPLYLSELRFVTAKIQEDVYNNSAWMQRHLVLSRLAAEFPEQAADVFPQELRFWRDSVGVAPGNESAWAYLAGMIRLPLGGEDPIGAACALVLELVALHPGCVPAVATAAGLYDQMERLCAAEGQAEGQDRARDAASCLRKRLAVIDPLRRGFWQSGAFCNG